MTNPPAVSPLRAQAEQIAEEVSGDVRQAEFDATGQHCGDFSEELADKIEAALLAVQQQERARCAQIAESFEASAEDASELAGIRAIAAAIRQEP